MSIFPVAVAEIVLEYSKTWALLPWIDRDKIDWWKLSSNPAAIDLLRENPCMINWEWLSINPTAIDLLRANPDKINWSWLSGNPVAIDLLRENPDKIKWRLFSKNSAIFELVNPSDVSVYILSF